MLKRGIAFGLAIAAVLALPAAAYAQNIYVKDATSGSLTQPPLQPNTVLLTFDDGPSKYTPKILKILREKHVHATFFVVGSQARQYPMLKQMLADGNEIGSHTYTHPDLTKQSEWRMRLELNATRLVINSQLGRSTRLFRMPYLGSDALTPQAKRAIGQAANLGYITVGETLDSDDWRHEGAPKIIANSVSEDGGIVLLHDGGGDRSQTVEALPQIISFYQDRGFRFATVSEALGAPQSEVMPTLSPIDHALAMLTTIVLAVASWLGRAFRWFIIVLIAAGFARFLIVTLAALIQVRRKRRYPRTQTIMPCTVLIPAYNEGTVIQSCLKSVLAGDYAHFEVLVIDDGSKDNTLDLANEIYDPRLRVIRKENGGKASALNLGIQEARNPFLIAIDADTIFRHDTITHLMRHFADPRVGAVSGNTKIVNRHKLITKLQSLEYIMGFNLDRRMGDLFDCITVVPGAVGAFRRSVIQKIGGFTFDTLAEDTDLTLAIKEAGHKIIYDDKAIALTEAPATARDLLKQRFRWTFGTMQAVWKHKRSFLNPRRGSLGMIGLPYLLLFQIIFPLFGPFFDMAMIVGLVNRQFRLIALSFIIYTVVDIFTAALALKLDGEKLRGLWILVPQRLLYRQLMYYVIAKSFINVLKGRLVRWGKLERKGLHLAANTSQ